jgi:hypothetical protein
VLEYKTSSINHIEAGNGIFVNSTDIIQAGKLLGFVPGVIFTHKDTDEYIDKLNRLNEELDYL